VSLTAAGGLAEVPASGKRGNVRWARSETVPLLAVVILAAVVRFATLGVQSFSDDELFTVWLMKMSFGHMISTVPRTEATPPLFYVLQWLDSRLFGMSEVGIRILSALAGTLTVPLVYLTGRVGVSKRVGLAAAVFVAVNPFLVWYSQEARAYALMTLFTAGGLCCLAGHWRSARTSWLVGWSVASALALLSHYFALFLVLPEAVWLLISGRQQWQRRLAAVLVPGVAGAALLPLALHQRSAVHDPGGVAGMPLSHRVAAIPKNFLVGFSIPAETFMIVATGLLTALALTLAVERGRGTSARPILLAGALLAGLGVLLPVLIAPFGFDYVSSRNVIPDLIPIALVLGYGFTANRWGIAALAGFAALSLVTILGIALSPQYQRPNWRGAAQALGRARHQRVVVFNPPFSNPGPFRVYFGQRSSLLRKVPVRVRELDVVALLQSKPFGPHTPRPPRARAPLPPPGFRLVQDSETSSYRLVRYLSSRPEPVSGVALERLPFPGSPSVFVLQSPPGRVR
jgi:mannosyltransferase